MAVRLPSSLRWLGAWIQLQAGVGAVSSRDVVVKEEADVLRSTCLGAAGAQGGWLPCCSKAGESMLRAPVSVTSEAAVIVVS
jgi:hypothetical protein